MFIHFQNCAVHEVHPLKPAFQQLCARSVAAWMFQALEYIRAELEHFFGAHKSYVSAPQHSDRQNFLPPQERAHTSAVTMH